MLAIGLPSLMAMLDEEIEMLAKREADAKADAERKEREHRQKLFWSGKLHPYSRLRRRDG
jgi:hypothetical protein